MAKIAFISPDERTAELVKRVAHRLGLSVSIKVGSGDERLPLALEACSEGAEVIVSRWGSSQTTIQAAVDVPLLNVEVTGYDIARALVEASKSGRPLGLLARESIVKGALVLAPLLGVQLRRVGMLTTYDPRELQEGLNSMRAAGVEVLLGGARVTSLAPSFGLNGFFIVAGEEAITEALVEANRIIPLKQREREKTEQVRAILDSAYDGVIAVDVEGRITVFNRMAEEISGLKASGVIGRPVSEVLRGLSFNEVLSTGKLEIGTIEKLGMSCIVMSRVPIMVNGKVVGAVATFVDASRIQRMEESVRKHLAARGMVARFTFEDIVGDSSRLRSAIEIARKYAEVDAPVLIASETGVGKEMFAQAIHNASSRRNGPFVAINCGALPESVLESELFGYVEGAFTGARKGGKAGLFELAHRGTVFLDEVSEMPVRIQTRFLRVLQEREVIRLGDEKVIPVDIRIIAATNKNLEDLVRTGSFREDLYYRINVLNLKIPPLRERGEDVLILFNYFLKHFGMRYGKPPLQLTPRLTQWLLGHTWPGNVRELENIAHRLVACSGAHEEYLFAEMAHPPESHSVSPPSVSSSGVSSQRLKEVEWEAIKKALTETRGNKSRAARLLGISTTTLWRRLKAHTREEREKLHGVQ